jgi:hypothetical protein
MGYDKDTEVLLHIYCDSHNANIFRPVISKPVWALDIFRNGSN